MLLELWFNNSVFPYKYLYLQLRVKDYIYRLSHAHMYNAITLLWQIYIVATYQHFQIPNFLVLLAL